MMKRGISLVTSLMMTASLVGGPAAQAFITSPVTLVSAAAAAPTLELVDIQVSDGVKKALVPVKVNAKDLAAMTVTLSVKTKAGNGKATITGIKKTDKYANISVGAEGKTDEKGNSMRTFMWNALSSEEDLPATIDNEIIAYVEVSFDGADKDSVFQLDVLATEATILEDINKEPDKGVTEFAKTGGWSSTVSFGDAAAVDYKAAFDVADYEYVSAGKVVPVTLSLECPSDFAKLGVIAAEFEASNGAKIVNVEGIRTGEGENYAVSENKSRIVWTWENADAEKVADFNKSSGFVKVYVQIPSDANTGDKFKVTAKMDTATTDHAEISPAEVPSIELSVTNATLEIASPKVKEGDKTVSIPVMITTPNGVEAASLTSNFKVSAGDKKIAIKSVEAGPQVIDSEVDYSKDSGNVLWIDDKGGKDVTLNGEMFIINVELPEDMKIGDAYQVTCGDAELVTYDRVTLGVDETSGTIRVVDPNVVTDGYKISMDSVTKTPTNDEVIVPVNVYLETLDGEGLSAFDGKFKVNNGAEIVSVVGEGISSGTKDPAHIYWQNAEGKNTKFDGKTVFATVNVKIPEGLATNRSSFTVSVDGELDTVNADRIAVLPVEPMGRGTITFLSSTKPPITDEHTTDIEIDSMEVAVEKEETVVSVPVKAVSEELAALNGKFTLTKAEDSDVYTLDLVDATAAAKGSVESVLTVKAGTLSLLTSEDYTVKSAEIVAVEDVTGETAAVISGEDNTIAWLNADGKTFTADDSFLVVKVAVTAESKSIVTTTTNEPGVVTTTTNEPGVVTTTTNEPGVVTTTTNEPGVVTTTTNEPGVVTTTTTNEPGVVTTTTNEPGVVTTTTNEPGVVTTTTNEPGVVTTTTTNEPGVVTTTTGGQPPIGIEFGGKLKMPVNDNGESDAVKVLPENNFYFSYEDKFNLAGLVVKVEIYVDGEKTDELDITDYVTVADGNTPADLFTEDGFNYNVLLEVNTDMLDDENMMIIGNKKYDASDLIANFNNVYVPVLIGMRGDVNLDNTVNALDMSVIVNERNSQAFGEDYLPTVPTIGEGMLDFAKFLGDISGDSELDPLDVTYISNFANEVILSQLTGEEFDAKKFWGDIDELLSSTAEPDNN